MNKIVMVAGAPGSGKSTWIKQQIRKSNKECVHISRDEIRFSLLKENDDYFAREKEVFKNFVNKIQHEIDTGDLKTIYVDATHLNKKSRAKVLNRLNLKDSILEIVWFDVPLKICLIRNAKRTGRAFVPEETIADMFLSMEPPTEDEAKIIKFIKW